jgi:antitoxin component HigA of HigAB toxin-antitoxin module
VPIEPIRNDDDHRAALHRIDALWNAPDDSPEADELDALATLVDAYERKRWPTEPGTPLDALKFAMDQHGATQKDLAEILGSRSRASEILNGKREMSLDQIRRLSKAWGIPIAMLVGEAEAADTASAA